MSTSDFGLSREVRIASSGIRNAFTPHQPIRSLSLFFGREKEVKAIVQQILTPGQHSLLYGDRGVGKSSLANVAAELILRRVATGTLYVSRCDSSATFESIVAKPLAANGHDPSLEESSETVQIAGEAGIKAPFLKAGVSTHTEATEKRHHARHPISPSKAADVLTHARGLLLVDEADSLTHLGDKKKLAEFIKLLSDAGSLFKVLVVGIARTGEELTGGHPSVQRCLKETQLQRMTRSELGQIISSGAKQTRLVFERSAVEAIVTLSSGYPHFTHLLALKCAEDAVSQGRDIIVLSDVGAAMQAASEDAEGDLRRQYEHATRSAETRMYVAILRAAATIQKAEFNSRELRDAYQRVFGAILTQASLNNYLNRLVSASGKTVLRRLSKGIYSFNDPRMPTFIRLVNADLSS